MRGRIAALWRYPVKGMTGEALEEVDLTSGCGVPGDRRWGFARPGSGFDPDDPKPLPKERFVVLLREAGLARLRSRLQGDVLDVTDGEDSGRFDLGSAPGRLGAGAFLRDRLGLVETPTLVRADPHRFTDVSVVSPAMMNAVSILSRSSVAAFAEEIDTSVDHRRFRMNVEVEGWAPWIELDAKWAEIRLGSACLRVILRTKRCAATEVNPETAERDLAIPRLLRQRYGHMDLGVYAEVVESGTIRIGDEAQLHGRAS